MGKVYAKISKVILGQVHARSSDPEGPFIYSPALNDLRDDLTDEPRELRVWGPWCVDMRELDTNQLRGAHYGSSIPLIQDAAQAALDWHKAQEQPTPAPDPSSPLVDVRIMPQWQRGHYLTAQFHKDDVFNLAVQHAVRCLDAREKKGGAA